MSQTQFLDPRSLARIKNLELLARTVVDGFISGLHHSPYLGLSVDFAEHRAYLPGDDIRRIDWRLYGRTDRYYLKEFEADTNANFSVLLDISRSMTYTSHGITKLDYARYLAASLSYFSRQQRDRVGIITFDSDVVDIVPPSARHLDIVLHTIDRIRPGESSNLDQSMRKAASTMKRRSILLVISDFYDEPESVLHSLNHLRNKKSDLIVFHVLDPAELELPLDDAATFEDMESGERIPVIPEQHRERYAELMSTHVSTLDSLLTENRIDYVMLNTSVPLDYALFSYLSRRERLSRVR